MQTDTVSRNIYFALISLLSASIAAALRRPRILQRRFAAREYCSGAQPLGVPPPTPHGGLFIWGSAPNPARFFEKSVGKIMFCHTFHEKTGMTLSEYVLEKRLSKAESMLRKGVRPVGEIALELGFSSVSYFCSVFNKKYGMSPLAYRKSAASLN